MRTTNHALAPSPARWLPRRPDTEPSSEAVRVEQSLAGRDPCFMTDKRLSCKEMDCELRVRCCRLVAVWMR